MDDTISRAAALEAMETYDKFGCAPDGKLVRYDDDKHYVPYVHYEDMVHVIKALPSTCHLLEDGTLIVTVSNLSEVHRVIVDEENSQYCKTFYQDGDEDDEPVYDCMTCRHGDGSPTAEPCSKCQYRFNNTPTKWEPMGE